MDALSDPRLPSAARRRRSGSPGPKEIWELSKRQSDHFPLGLHEWPALMRLCEKLDPGFKQ